MFWKRTFCQTEGIGWSFLSDPVSLTVMLCIGSLFLIQMLFITTETHCLSQGILIYATFQDTREPNGDVDPEIYLKGQQEGSRLQSLPKLSPVSVWDRRGVAESRETCLEVVRADYDTQTVWKGRREATSQSQGRLRWSFPWLPMLCSPGRVCPLSGSWCLTWTVKSSSENIQTLPPKTKGGKNAEV